MGIINRDNSILKSFLKPLSWLYGGIADLRNTGYDRGWLPTHQPPCKTIAVGNLTVGGTGKTPMVEFLVRLLSSHCKIAVVSRGYGRKSTGLVIANENSTAGDIGDEPLQFYRKFSGQIRVIVAENRSEAARTIAAEFPETELILLDDAFQHRAIKRDSDILLTDYNRLFYEDLPFPAGNLRERKKGAGRAGTVVVTKSPANLSDEEKESIKSRIYRYARQRPPVFFSSVRYGAPIPFKPGAQIRDYERKKGFSGLARNTPFEQFLRENYQTDEFKGFPDHHDYSVSDLTTGSFWAGERTALLTTEKDMVKLIPLMGQVMALENAFYIPIEVAFHENAAFEMHLERLLSPLLPG